MSGGYQTVLAGFAAVLMAGSASAAITYVDATSGSGGNTALAAGGTFSPGTAASGTDGLWRSRAFGNGATIVEAGGDNSGTGSAVDGNNENVARLATTITGLTPGSTYAIYTFFWDTTGPEQNWPVRSGLTNPVGDLPLFNDPSAPLAGTLTFTNAPLVTEGDRSMRGASLGNAVANGLGQIVVYVDDDPAARAGIANGWGFRTWYDGVGYEIVPEPASIALLGLGGLAVLRRRRTA